MKEETMPIPPASCGGCDTRWTGYKIEHCQMCHETFSGTTAGDRHRVSTYEPMARRCLSPDEMREKGMRQNKRGVWTTGGGYWADDETSEGEAALDRALRRFDGADR